RKIWWLQPADVLSIASFNMPGLGVVGRQSSHLPCHQAVMRRSRPEMATNTVRGRTTGKPVEARNMDGLITTTAHMEELFTPYGVSSRVWTVLASGMP
ncbi:hypothetical protein MPDQ_004943, partial [Monascus purpureus]